MKKFFVSLMGLVAFGISQGCASDTNLHQRIAAASDRCYLPKEHMSQENDYLPKAADHYRYNDFGTKQVIDTQVGTSVSTPYINPWTGHWDTAKSSSTTTTHEENPIYPTYYGSAPVPIYYQQQPAPMYYQQGGTYSVAPQTAPVYQQQSAPVLAQAPPRPAGTVVAGVLFGYSPSVPAVQSVPSGYNSYGGSYAPTPVQIISSGYYVAP